LLLLIVYIYIYIYKHTHTHEVRMASSDITSIPSFMKIDQLVQKVKGRQTYTEEIMAF